jgi:hypothetical protein
MMLPVHPTNSVHLGHDVFVNISEYNEVIRVHVRKYAPNAISFTPTAVGVSFKMDEWRTIAPLFDNWLDQVKLSSQGVLFTSQQFAVTYLSVDGKKFVNFVLANRKQIDIDIGQFRKLCEAVSQIDQFYDQMSCENFSQQDSQVY